MSKVLAVLFSTNADLLTNERLETTLKIRKMTISNPFTYKCLIAFNNRQ